MRAISDNATATKGNGCKELRNQEGCWLRLSESHLLQEGEKQCLARCMSIRAHGISASTLWSRVQTWPVFLGQTQKGSGCYSAFICRVESKDSFSAVQVHFLTSSPCSLLGKDQLCNIFKVTVYLLPSCLHLVGVYLDSKTLVTKKNRYMYIYCTHMYNIHMCIIYIYIYKILLRRNQALIFYCSFGNSGKTVKVSEAVACYDIVFRPFSLG